MDYAIPGRKYWPIFCWLCEGQISEKNWLNKWKLAETHFWIVHCRCDYFIWGNGQNGMSARQSALLLLLLHNSICGWAKEGVKPFGNIFGTNFANRECAGPLQKYSNQFTYILTSFLPFIHSVSIFSFYCFRPILLVHLFKNMYEWNGRKCIFLLFFPLLSIYIFAISFLMFLPQLANSMWKLLDPPSIVVEECRIHFVHPFVQFAKKPK